MSATLVSKTGETLMQKPLSHVRGRTLPYEAQLRYFEAFSELLNNNSKPLKSSRENGVANHEI